MILRLTLIVSFCASAIEVVNDAYHQLISLDLERLLARAREVECECRDDAYLPTLPRECWLAKHTGLSIPPLPSMPYMRLADGGIADTRTWVCLQSVHTHVVRDHLVMPDPAQLRLKTADANALRAAIAPLVDEMGITLDTMHAARWYVIDLPFDDLIAAAPQHATDHNTGIWMHKGEQEHVWRKLQNEIQMMQYDYPINQACEARDLPLANSVWLFGQGALADARSIAERMIGADPFFAGLCHTSYATELCAETLAAVPFDDTSTATLLGDVGKPYLSADWYDWAETLRTYDRDWFSFAADALADGRIDAVSFMLTDDSHYVHYRVTRREPAIGPSGWLRRFSRPRTLCDAFSSFSMAA